MLTWKRTLRTASSERFVAIRDGREVAGVDLHYLASGTVAATVVLLRDKESADGGWREAQVPDLLASLDEDYLPDVDLASGDLTYTVILGDVVGGVDTSMGPEFDSRDGV
ncbi:MAG: hypothetical protein ACT4PL_03550 [Phycisphaerales bacterium]